MTLLVVTSLKLAITFLILWAVPYSVKESILKNNKKARRICGWIASVFMALLISTCITVLLIGIWQIGA